MLKASINKYLSNEWTSEQINTQILQTLVLQQWLHSTAVPNHSKMLLLLLLKLKFSIINLAFMLQAEDIFIWLIASPLAFFSPTKTVGFVFITYNVADTGVPTNFVLHRTAGLTACFIMEPHFGLNKTQHCTAWNSL